MGVREDKRKSSRRKADEFYILTYPPRELASGREFLNEDEVCRGSGSVILSAPSPFHRGFRNYGVRPRFRVSKRLGRKPYDVEPYSEYWLVSDRAKQLFDEINEADFAYLAVDTEFDPGSDTTTYWLCDIVSVLDAVDEARSAVESSIADDGSKIHLLAGRCSLAFDENLVGQHCVFRMKTSYPTLIGSERFKIAFKQAQLTGLSFMEAFEPPFDKIGTVTALPPSIGTIKPEGRGKEVFFFQDVLDSLGGSLKIGDTVRVQGRHNRHYRSYSATRLEKISGYSHLPANGARPIQNNPMTSTSLPKLNIRLLTFGDNTKAVALAIAARSALRTIPLLERLSWEKPLRKRMRAALGRERMSNSAIVLGTFRSAATAWVAARFHSFGMSDRFHEIKDDARMAGGAEDAGKTAAAMAPAATHYAMMAAISLFSHRPPQSLIDESLHRKDSAISASHTTTVAAVGFMEAYDPQSAERFHASRDPQWFANRELSEAERVIWDAAWEDVQRLEDGGDNTLSLLMQALWLTPPPQHVCDDWRNLSARLLGRRDEGWSVWIDWYEARIAGCADPSERDEIARVSLPNEVWAQGAASANASISRLLV